MSEENDAGFDRVSQKFCGFETGAVPVGCRQQTAGWIETDRRWHAFRHTEKSCNCENNDCFDCGEWLNKGNASGIHCKCTSYNNDNHDYNHYNQGNNYNETDQDDYNKGNDDNQAKQDDYNKGNDDNETEQDDYNKGNDYNQAQQDDYNQGNDYDQTKQDDHNQGNDDNQAKQDHHN